MKKGLQQGVITVEEAKSLETETRSSKACIRPRLHLAYFVTNAQDARWKWTMPILINEKKLSA